MTQPRPRRTAALATVAALASVVAGPAAAPAAAQVGSFCADVEAIMAAAPEGFRSLRSADYATSQESWRATLALGGFDSCWIDDVEHRFWCRYQAPDRAAATRRTTETGNALSACLAGAAPHQASESLDNNVTRAIAVWTFANGRRIHLVHRHPTRGPGLSAVFLYVY